MADEVIKPDNSAEMAALKAEVERLRKANSEILDDYKKAKEAAKAVPQDVDVNALIAFKQKKEKEMSDPRIKRFGLAGFNKPKRTPSHPTKSHVVLAKEGDKVKLIRFGMQGAKNKPPRKGESDADKAKRKSFKARPAKNIAKGKMSAAFWADRTKWS